MQRLILCIWLFTLVSSCEDVVEIDTPSEAPRLIIDALVRVDTSSPQTLVSVKVAETNSFFGEIPPTGLQQITLAGAILLEEEPGSGIYSRLVSTSSLMNEDVFLAIDFEDEIYVAFADFIPATPINSISQGEGFLIDEDETEIIVNFSDPEERTDFYLFDFDFSNYLVTEDTFYNGQDFEFSYFYDENLNPGDEVVISIMGIDEGFYNYMNLLIDQSEIDFGPFETPAVTVRGNIFNVTELDNIVGFVNDPDNFPLGYFAIVEEFKQTITIE